MREKMNVKKTALAFVSCSMVMANMMPLTTIFAETKDSTIQEYVQNENVVENVLQGLSGDVNQYTANKNVYSLNAVSGNNILISNTTAIAFEYEAKIKYKDGVNSASLVFGAENNNYKEFGKLFGLALEKKEDNKLYIKMFQDGANSVGLVTEVDIDTKKVYNNDSVSIKLIVDENKEVSVYIDGSKIDMLVNEKFKPAYAGGYIGLMSFQSSVEFSDVKLSKKDGESNFISSLTNLRGLQGSWVPSTDGLVSAGSGDNFAVSDTYVAGDFSYSANIKNTGNKGAGALMFGVSNNADPTKGCYVINADYTHNIFKLFRFPGGGSVEEVAISRVEPKADGSYDIAISVVGKRAYVQVNGIGIMDVTLNEYNGGNLGLLTWDGNVTYQDVKHNVDNVSIPDITYGSLSDFEILTKGVTITPHFDPKVKDYGMDIPAGIDTVKLKPTIDDGKMYVTFKGREGNVLKAKEEVTDLITITKDDFENQFMNMELIVENDGFIQVINFAVNKWFSVDELANQEWRSQFHVTPQVNFMNDPNGMVFDPTDGYWHMHYQYSTKNGFHNQSWAHVRSKDLVNWEQLPLAMQIDELGLIFSGSAISLTEKEAQRDDILEGVFKDNKPGESRLVAFYTYAKGAQTQGLAYSKDHGRTWIKYHGNPILDSSNSMSGNDFRDPKVFKVPGDDKHWYMVTAGGAAQMFVSENLTDWTRSQTLNFKDGGAQIHSECPGLNPAKIEGSDEVKWIYNGSDGFYIVGDMIQGEDGIYRWVAESDIIAVDSNENPWGGFGKYANMTFYEDGTGQGRHIGVSWLQDIHINFPGKIYWGAQSLPFEYKLKQRENGEYIVKCTPVKEIEKLRDTDNILYTAKNKTVNEDDKNILKGVSGIRYDLEATFTLGSAEQFGFKLRKGNGKEIIYKYDVKSQKMILDISNGGYHQNSGNYAYELIPLDDNKVKLRIIVDQGAIEAFGNDGEANISTVCYTNNDNIAMEFFSDGGDVIVDELNIYDMKSMYSGKSGSQSETAKLYLNAMSEVEVNTEFSVDANIYPNLKQGQDIIWKYDDGLKKVSSEKGSITFTAVKEGTYQITGSTADNSLSETISVKVYKPNFVSNIINWHKIYGGWKTSSEGMRGENVSIGDSFYMSDTMLQSDVGFTLEADMILEDGFAGGITFGVEDVNNPGNHWYCVNVDKEKNVAKLFENRNGQLWSIERKLTADEIKKKEYHLKVVYDGLGKFTYYLDGVEVGYKENVQFAGGYAGIMTFRANATFNNVNLKTDGTDVSYEALKDVEIFAGHSLDELEEKMPKNVTVTQSDKITKKETVTWNYDSVDLYTAGNYEVKGSISSSNLEIVVNVNVKDNTPVIEGTLKDVEIKKGSSEDDLIASLPKKVILNYPDGTTKEAEVYWILDNVKLDKEGTYKIMGEVQGSRIVAEMNVIVKDIVETKPIVPEINEENGPETGVENTIPYTSGTLLVSAGVAAYLVNKKRKENRVK